MDPFIEGMIIAVVAYTCCLFVCVALCVAAGSADRQAERLEERERGN